LYLVITIVDAHGRLSLPSPRGFYVNKPDYQEEAPVPSVTSDDFSCRGDAASTPSNYLALTAGGTIQMTWILPAPHVGDCFAYITYDSALPIGQQNWFKIAQWPDCRNTTGVANNLLIPSYLPACTHCILRWEWYALHVWPTIEFYSQCVDVSISGTGSQLPLPQVKIPGNLPADGQQYRNPFGTGPQFITGPPVATLGGAVTTGIQSGSSTTGVGAASTTSFASTTRGVSTSKVTTKAVAVTTFKKITTKAVTSAYARPTTGSTFASNTQCYAGLPYCYCTQGGGCDPGYSCQSPGICLPSQNESSSESLKYSLLFSLVFVIATLFM